MNVKLPESITRTAGKVGLELTRKRPEILLATGLVLGVVSTVAACYATTKLEDTLKEEKEGLEKLHEVIEDPERMKKLKYTERDAANDRIIFYSRMLVKAIKLYSPALISGGLGIVCILSGHKIIRERNAALAATAAGLNKALSDYRSRVSDAVGADVEKDIWCGIKKTVVEKNHIINPDGTEEILTEEVTQNDKTNKSPFSVIFDCRAKEWKSDPDDNFFLLRMKEKVLTDNLRINGYVFLNDVYDALGMPKTQYGNIYGWVYDDSRTVNEVSFGTYSMQLDEEGCSFVQLDFNLDGDILSNELFTKFDKIFPHK